MAKSSKRKPFIFTGERESALPGQKGRIAVALKHGSAIRKGGRLKAFFASEGFAGAPLQRRLKENLGPEFILGEATPATLEKLQDQYRFHVLMRGGAIVRLSRRVRETLDKLPFPEDVAVAVDVDPYQLL